MTRKDFRLRRGNYLKSKPISQGHAMGCGLACVAYLVGKSYRSVLAADSDQTRAWTRGYYCPELVELLFQFGLKYTWRELKRGSSATKIPVGSIVFEKPTLSCPAGHFLVKVADGVYMNPWINAPSIKGVRAGYQNNVGVITHVITPL